MEESLSISVSVLPDGNDLLVFSDVNTGLLSKITLPPLCMYGGRVFVSIIPSSQRLIRVSSMELLKTIYYICFLKNMYVCMYVNMYENMYVKICM